MAETRDPASYTDFDELMERLSSIVDDVKAKDVTIEQSLDLLEEGIALGLRATDIVEDPTFTAAEREALAEPDEAEAADDAPAADASEDVVEIDELEAGGAGEEAEASERS